MLESTLLVVNCVLTNQTAPRTERYVRVNANVSARMYHLTGRAERTLVGDPDSIVYVIETRCVFSVNSPSGPLG